MLALVCSASIAGGMPDTLTSPNGVWEPQWCVVHNRWYYMNKVRGVSSWSRPPDAEEDLPATAPNLVDEAPGGCLPDGWEMAYDVQYTRYYFFHRELGTRQWNFPCQRSSIITSGDDSLLKSPPQTLTLPVAVRCSSKQHTTSSRSKKKTLMLAADEIAGEKSSWDAEATIFTLNKAIQEGDSKARRKVFRQVAEDNYLRQDQWSTGETVLQSHVELVEWFERTAAPSSPKRVPQVTFSTGTVADAILYFGKLHPGKVVALNSADGMQVGGNYKCGSPYAEEDLCRRIPSLYGSLYQAKRDGHYPFGPGASKAVGKMCRFAETLWTTNVAVARLAEDQGFAILPENERARVCIVSAAAPNPGKVYADGSTEVWDEDLVYMTIKSIFLAPAKLHPSTRVLILSTFGCRGSCDPNAIARLFTKALAGKDFLGRFFSEVHFAIPHDEGDSTSGIAFRAAMERARISTTELKVR